MRNHRTKFGFLTIASLVLLRVVIGWHFYSEGLQKVTFDPSSGEYKIVFSAEGFLRGATGPLAGLFHAQVPSVHDWPTLLAVAHENRPLTPDEIDSRQRWLADYALRRKAAVTAKEPVPIEFPPFAPYHDWATKVVADRRAALEEVNGIEGLSGEQLAAAAEAFVMRQQQLADYLAGEADSMVEYQHELWRLENWLSAPEAEGVPYASKRIVAKQAETGRLPLPWINQVREFDVAYADELRDILTPDQRTDEMIVAAMDDAVTEPAQKWLTLVNMAVTIMTLTVGLGLMIGFFTRTLSVVGALFLLSVVVSQPPWVAGAAPTIYQSVELAGLLVLATVGAGRWAGLDFFTYSLWNRCFGARDNTSRSDND